MNILNLKLRCFCLIEYGLKYLWGQWQMANGTAQVGVDIFRICETHSLKMQISNASPCLNQSWLPQIFYLCSCIVNRGTGGERADAWCSGALAEVVLLNESGLNSSILPALSFIVLEIRMRQRVRGWIGSGCRAVRAFSPDIVDC